MKGVLMLGAAIPLLVLMGLAWFVILVVLYINEELLQKLRSWSDVRGRPTR